MRRKLAAAALSLVFSLLIAEVVLRAVGPSIWATPFDSSWPWIEFDPFFLWRNQPGSWGTSVEVNEFGFRGEAIALEKPEGTLRVLMLGDSGTFGVGKSGLKAISVENHPAKLAELLRDRPGPPVEVINAGVLGYASGHGLRMLLGRGVQLEPDVVIARFGFNDHSPSWDPALRGKEPELGFLLPWFYASSDSGLMNAALFVIQKLTFLHPDRRSILWSEVPEFEQELRRMAQVAREQGFTLMFLDYPIRAHSRGKSEEMDDGWFKFFGVNNLYELHQRHKYYQAVMRKVASEEGVRVIETASRCQALEGACFNEFDLVHPTGVGHRVIAEAVRDALIEEWGEEDLSDCGPDCGAVQ